MSIKIQPKLLFSLIGTTTGAVSSKKKSTIVWTLLLHVYINISIKYSYRFLFPLLTRSSGSIIELLHATLRLQLFTYSPENHSLLPHVVV